MESAKMVTIMKIRMTLSSFLTDHLLENQAPKALPIVNIKANR
jgi:hypothetical protein